MLQVGSVDLLGAVQKLVGALIQKRVHTSVASAPYRSPKPPGQCVEAMAMDPPGATRVSSMKAGYQWSHVEALNESNSNEATRRLSADLVGDLVGGLVGGFFAWLLGWFDGHGPM